jgi:hypothetical protein
MSDFSCATKIVATRISHHCEWCHTLIGRLQPAWRQSSKIDGMMVTFYLHEDCWDACVRDPCRLKDGRRCRSKHNQGQTCVETNTGEEEIIWHA